MPFFIFYIIISPGAPGIICNRNIKIKTLAPPGTLYRPEARIPLPGPPWDPPVGGREKKMRSGEVVQFTRTKRRVVHGHHYASVQDLSAFSFLFGCVGSFMGSTAESGPCVGCVGSQSLCPFGLWRSGNHV